ncbi:inhibin beta B chain [Anguilla anguilla]|uniref:inhibin beta B chain n=1 Tax=Anguilla anguilla TaxID=7936 RepID=UPI0015ABC4C3|nr:inhibin beta B chain [Anguilla anguilla]
MRLLSCVLLLACCFSRVAGRPHLSQGERSLWLEAVKKGILESLGMDGPPASHVKPRQEELRRMYFLYERELQELHRNHSQAAGTQRPTVNRASTVLLPAQVQYLETQRFRAIFHKTHLIRKELILVQAKLKLCGHFLDKHRSGQPVPRQEVQVKIHQIINKTAQEPLKNDGLVLTKVLDSNSLTLDIHPTVEIWRASMEEPLVLEVEFVTGREKHPEGTPELVLEMEVTEPVLEKRRKRRRAPVKDDCEGEDRCCRKSLSVSFKDIGWSDWVVAPEGYTMYFCDGSCPSNYRPASMHTQVKSRLHRMTKGATPRPCCVPASYEPMVIMHYDSQGKLTFTTFNDMIVSSCHCA